MGLNFHRMVSDYLSDACQANITVTHKITFYFFLDWNHSTNNGELVFSVASRLSLDIPIIIARKTMWIYLKRRKIYRIWRETRASMWIYLKHTESRHADSIEKVQVWCGDGRGLRRLPPRFLCPGSHLRLGKPSFEGRKRKEKGDEGRQMKGLVGPQPLDQTQPIIHPWTCYFDAGPSYLHYHRKDSMCSPRACLPFYYRCPVTLKGKTCFSSLHILLKNLSMT